MKSGAEFFGDVMSEILKSSRTGQVLPATFATRSLMFVKGVLETPEELQGQFVGEKHGGAHGEASNGVD